MPNRTFASPYHRAASSLQASISASAAPTTRQTSATSTKYIGISGSVTTPVGGAELGVGFYSGAYGMVGSYFSVGPAAGIPGASLGIVSGSSQSFAGESVSASAGLGDLFGVSRGYSFDPTTGEQTGEYWSAGLSAGPPVSGSVGYGKTLTSEFTSLYTTYVQFLNYVGYPGGGSAGDH